MFNDFYESAFGPELQPSFCVGAKYFAFVCGGFSIHLKRPWNSLEPIFRRLGKVWDDLEKKSAEFQISFFKVRLPVELILFGKHARVTTSDPIRTVIPVRH